MSSFFCHELQLITVLLLICDSYMSWSTRFVSLKLCVGFSIFDSVLFLLKFIFFFNKMHGFFDFKNHNSFQNEKNWKATHSLAPRPLIFKLQQEVLKFNDICVSWSSPNLTWWHIFKPGKLKFWERQFFSLIVNIWYNNLAT